MTLTEAPGEVCYGRAFLIEHDVFEHLDHREKNGYRRLDVTIRFDDGVVRGVTYYASPDNVAFLGDAPLELMARQIGRSHGPSGSNREYVVALARSLREHDIDDRHVFEIERMIEEEKR